MEMASSKLDIAETQSDELGDKLMFPSKIQRKDERR
jgi:hypothetical protein